MSKIPITTKHHMRSSIRDGIYTHLNIGMNESYFCAFMLALGISEVLSGLGTIVPQFIGVVFQLFSIRSFFTQFSLKKRISLFLLMQSLSLVPLIGAGWLKFNNPFVIIGILSFYWANLLSLNPPWNRLMGHTIPLKFRLKFFAIRNQFGQLSVFLGLLVTGLILHFTNNILETTIVYSLLFTVGLILKLLSLKEIQFHHNDYALSPVSEKRITFRVFLNSIQGTDQGKLIAFLFLFYVTVHFSAPYFNPFMLAQLKFNYLQFMTVTSVAYFGRVIMFKILEKKALPDKMEKILHFSCLGICTSPLLWTFSQNFYWILIIEFLSGCYWAGFELSTILLYYQKIRDEERTSAMTYIAFLNTTGMILGSLMGALFMKILPISWNPYLSLFILSTLLRLSLLSFTPHVDFKSNIPRFLMALKTVTSWPLWGYFERSFRRNKK